MSASMKLDSNAEKMSTYWMRQLMELKWAGDFSHPVEWNKIQNSPLQVPVSSISYLLWASCMNVDCSRWYYVSIQLLDIQDTSHKHSYNFPSHLYRLRLEDSW